MARITKSDAAPADAKHFSLANVEFDLSGSAAYETDDSTVIANARSNPFLKVEEDTVAPAQQVAEVDPLDPHRNPSADHLSTLASPSAVKAAEANESAIREAAGLNDSFAVSDGAPTIAETLEATFETAAPDAEPKFPADAKSTAKGPKADQPGGGTSEPPVDAASDKPRTTSTPPAAPADGS